MVVSFPQTARPLLELISPCPPTPEFIDPLATDLEEGLELIRAAPQDLVRADLTRCWQAHASPGTSPPLWIRNLADGDRQARELVIRALRDLYRACVEPFWENVAHGFRADLAARIPVLATGGYEQLLASIHPQLTWRDHGLEREGGSGHYALGGTGLQLFPSAFWSGPPAFAIRPPELGGNVLFYAAADGAEVTGPGDAAWPRRDDSRERPPRAGGGQPGGHCGLAALLGHTRAEVLGALQEPGGTTELATRLHISASSASEHIAALRGAGLAHTARHGRTVRHSLTPLGQDLLSAARRGTRTCR
jgi:DNA-binding transcriptional ArsR family regulator